MKGGGQNGGALWGSGPKKGEAVGLGHRGLGVVDGLVNTCVRCLVRAGLGLVRTGRMVHGTEFGR